MDWELNSHVKLQWNLLLKALWKKFRFSETCLDAKINFLCYVSLLKSIIYNPFTFKVPCWYALTELNIFCHIYTDLTTLDSSFIFRSYTFYYKFSFCAVERKCWLIVTIKFKKKNPSYKYYTDRNIDFADMCLQILHWSNSKILIIKKGSNFLTFLFLKILFRGRFLKLILIVF